MKQKQQPWCRSFFSDPNQATHHRPSIILALLLGTAKCLEWYEKLVKCLVPCESPAGAGKSMFIPSPLLGWLFYGFRMSPKTLGKSLKPFLASRCSSGTSGQTPMIQYSSEVTVRSLSLAQFWEVPEMGYTYSTILNGWFKYNGKSFPLTIPIPINYYSNHIMGYPRMDG